MQYRIGDVVTYKAFGASSERTVKVTGLDTNKGEPCFDGQVMMSFQGQLYPAQGNFTSVWGYDRQITSVNGVPTYGATGVQS